MNTYIALLRGINVGGHNKLPMKELRTLMGQLGYQNVNTYIQTGNVIFQAKESDKEKMAMAISDQIEKNKGFNPDIMLLELDEIVKAITSNPFPEAVDEPKRLHLWFLASEPGEPELDALEEIKRDNERFELIGKVFYLYAPDGIGRSKLAERVGKKLGVSTTARNWRTVSKIMEMIKGYIQE